MPRLIVKCRYYQQSKLHTNIAGMLSYIAKREGVEKLEDSWKSAPPTEAQLKMITAITDKCSGTTRTSEYKEFCQNRTRGYASEFISSALEDHPFLLEDKTYLDYIATRPRTEMLGGTHGLFSDDGVSIDLKDEVEKMREFRGNVFTVIMSLKREDAERVQMNSAERWRELIRSNINDVAKAHNILPQNLRWYAAYHNEPSHPHIHIMLYSTEENSKAFITKKGIEKIRRTFGTQIFAQDLKEIYDKQTAVRNKLNAESKYEIQLLIDQINSGICASDELRNKLQTLAERLRQCPKSTKKYGYLPKGVKDLVDELVDELEKTEPITSLYETWYRLKCDVWRTYTEQFPPKKPLSQEDAFKPIKNALINEAVKLGAEFTEDEKTEKKKPEYKADRKPAPVNKGLRVFNALVRFGYSLSQMFRDKFQSFDSEDEDIDKKLRQEIEAVKNGQNPTM